MGQVPWQSISGILGTIRDLFRSRPQLKVFQKSDPGYVDLSPAVSNRTGETHIGFFTMLIANQSADPNTVIRYDIDATLPDGSFLPIQLEQGVLEYNATTPVNVTPVDIAAHSTQEAHFWIPINAREFGNPIKLNITVTDRLERQYFGFCEIPNPYAKR